MQESPQRTENQMVELPRTPADDDLGFFDGANHPMPRNAQRGTPSGTIFGIALAVIVVGAGAFFFLSPRGGNSSSSTASYRSQTVVQGNLSLTNSATGPIQGTIYNADFLITGKISKIDVSVGQHVHSGQTLAELDVNSLPNGANTADATLTAPHAGTVTAINGAVGASSGTGSSTTHFIQIVDTSSLQIVANVNEADIAKVAVNNAVQFTVDAFGSQQFYGKVTAIAPQGTTTSNVVTYPVTINVDMTKLNGAHLLPGMTATAVITTDSRTNVLLIPVGTVSFVQTAVADGLVSQSQVGAALAQARQQLLGLQNAGGNGGGIARDNPSPAVVLEIVNGQWVAKPVVLGLTDGTVYEVLDGLAEGESIITSAGSPGSSTPTTLPGGGG